MHVFTFQEIEMMAEALLKSGIPPRTVRTRLAEKGIRWEYQFLGQGRKERLRRLAKTGHNLCKCGAGKLQYRDLCDDCLDKKWRE